MTTDPYLDPLDAAKHLLDHLAGRDGSTPTPVTLARHLDSFMYALRYLLIDSVSMVPKGELKHPEDAYETWREVTGPRFEMMGYYWRALSSHVKPGEKPEIGTGDAIDDLADIASEFTIVEAHLNAFGREDALAALRQAYEVHLHMHIVPLRAYLEELIFE